LSKESTNTAEGKISRNWVAIVGLILSLVATVILVYKFVIEDLIRRPRVQLTPPSSLNVMYRAQEEVVEFNFEFNAENTGKVPEVISTAAARLTNPSVSFNDRINYIPFATDDIIFTMDDKGCKAPFAIKEGTMPLTCEFAQKLGERSRQILQSPGRLLLSLYLNGKDGKDYQLDCCFNIDAEKLKSKVDEGQVLRNPECP
jgi:hypothetical protein